MYVLGCVMYVPGCVIYVPLSVDVPFYIPVCEFKLNSIFILFLILVGFKNVQAMQ